MFELAEAKNRAGFLTMGDFAEEIGVSKDTVRGWVDRRIVKSIRAGRRRLIDVQATADHWREGGGETGSAFWG